MGVSSSQQAAKTDDCPFALRPVAYPRLIRISDALHAPYWSNSIPDPYALTALSSSKKDECPSATQQSRQEHRTIAKNAAVVAGGTLVSRLLGLVRDQVIAAIFTRSATDAFFVAFTIPNVLRQLVAEGAVQNAVLPVLEQVREVGGDTRARSAYATLRGFSLVVLSAITIVGVVFAPQLVDLFAAGYRQIPGQFERTVRLTRYLFPYIFFMGTAALGVAALNLCRRFLVTSYAPGLLNIAFIVCGLALPAWLARNGGDPILALAIAALIGGALQVLAQWPSLVAAGYFGWPRLNINDAAIRETLRRMGPVLLGIGVYYVDVMLARRFLSNLGVGSQSYFSWAMRLCDFPQGIFVMALQSATLPSLSRLVARGELDVAAETFSHGMRLTLWITLAATVGAVALANPLIALVFERGNFDTVATEETAKAFMAQGIGIWMVAAVRQLVAVYYALGDTRTPVKVAAIDLIAFIVSAQLLAPRYGHIGVGLAVSIASLTQMLLLWHGLRSRLKISHTNVILSTILQTLCLATVAAVVARRVATVSQEFAHHGWHRHVFPGLLSSLAFVSVFLLLAKLFKSPELELLQPARHRMS